MINPFRWWNVQLVEAHCDIPCGIYDPIIAKIAAQTVQKMVQRIQDLEVPAANADSATRATYENTMGRYVTVKEEHAELCKKELRILWADYFRPEHVEKYPNLHTDIWNAEKLAGRNKQTVNIGAAKELVAAVDRIAQIFWTTKNVTYSDSMADVRYGT
jgi:nickel superoxide dismutase